MPKIEVKKTAKVSVLGELGQNHKEIWIVVHGYGQLSNYFIQKFNSIANNNRLIIAPEGLHRFYVNGVSGRVGASWMTKEQRLDDIGDYVTFLDEVYRLYVLPNKSDLTKVVLFGFSQGTATICRWYLQTKHQFNSIILWSGMLPPDLNLENNESKDWSNLILAYDKQDPYYNKVHFQNQINFLNNNNISYSECLHEDRHNISDDSLQILL